MNWIWLPLFWGSILDKCPLLISQFPRGRSKPNLWKIWNSVSNSVNGLGEENERKTNNFVRHKVVCYTYTVLQRRAGWALIEIALRKEIRLAWSLHWVRGKCFCFDWTSHCSLSDSMQLLRKTDIYKVFSDMTFLLRCEYNYKIGVEQEWGKPISLNRYRMQVRDRFADSEKCAG